MIIEGFFWQDVIFYHILFVFAALFLFGYSRQKSALGLCIAFSVMYLINYLFGTLTLYSSWFEFTPRFFVFQGLKSSVVSFVAFAIGVCIALKVYYVHSDPQPTAQYDAVRAKRLVNFAFVLFGLSLLTPLISQIGVTGQISGALLGTLANFSIPALIILFTVKPLPPRVGVLRLLMVPIFPVYYLGFEGFLGFGVAFILTLGCIIVLSSKRPSLYILATPILAFFAISFFVTYFKVRTDFRSIIWSDATVSQRVNAVVELGASVEFINLEDPIHLAALDQRLNQAGLIGAAIDATQSGRTAFFNGESLWVAAVSWVPRIVWADKPEFGGSGDLVSKITGITFAEGTAIGIGPPLELYANGGFVLMYGGMLALGFFAGWIDIRCRQKLESGDIKRFLVYSMAALPLISNINSLAEIFAATAAAPLVCLGIFYVLDRSFKEISVGSAPRAQVFV